MKVRILLQVGAFHKSKDDPDKDFKILLRDPKELLDKLVKLEYDFHVLKNWKLPDGSTHLLELEAVVYTEDL